MAGREKEERPAPDEDLRAVAFDSQVVGAEPESVLRLLGKTTREIPEVNLRSVDDLHGPIVLPSGTARGSPLALGHFQVAGEIAHGGVGSILKARDVDLGRDVAVKVLRDTHRGNAEMTRRFIEEAQIAGQLQHPGVVPVYELGVLEGDRPFFAMKLVQGKTLAEILRERASPAQERRRLIGIFERVCETLAYAHARGVIHRDLKPSNIMVGAFGETQVMDWGLAKVLARGGAADDRRAGGAESAVRTLRTAGDGSDSIAGSVIGTPAYMAPEQAEGRTETLDERTDVFGLGAILCEILTGKPPYTGTTLEDLFRQAREGALDDARARLASSDAERELVDLAIECLAVDPGARPPNAGAVRDRIRAYLDSLEARTRTSEIRAARARFRMILAAILTAVFILAAAVFVWLERDRMAREAEIAEAAERAMGNAQALRLQADAGGHEDLSLWDGALREASRAVELASERGGAAIRSRAKRLCDEIAAEVRDRQLVARLERIREERGFIFDELSREFREGLLSQAIEDDLRAALDGLDRSLREAFESIGIDLGDPPERIASQIASSRVATSILLALDQWVTLLDLRPDADPKMEEKLFRTAQLADPDAWRWDLRRAQREKDLAALRALADGDEIRRQAPSTLESLAFTFRRLGDPERERSVLVLCQRLHPDDFWINARLGKVFLEAKRFDEALLFVMVAVALRPASGYAHRLLALAYLGKGNIEGAVEAFRKDIALAPGSFRSYYSLSQILERGAKAVGSAALDEIIRTLEGIAASGEAFHTDGLIRLLAEALFLQGEKARAILALEESLRVPGIQHGSFTTPAGYDLSHAQILARYRAAGEPARAERVLCDLLGRADMRYRAVWNLWLAISFADLGRSPAETRAVIPAPGVAAAIDHPRSPIRVASEYEADVRWLLDRLESGGPICINAGGDDYVCATGALWCRDRFFTAGGTTYLHGRGRMLDDIAGTEDDPIFQTERWFAPNPCGPIGYEIPLPPGAYTVALHFAEVYAPEKRQPAGHERAFDVLIQGKAVLSNYGPLRKGFAAADRWTFPAIVRDGILSIEFVHRVENPKISGLEIVRAP